MKPIVIIVITLIMFFVISCSCSTASVPVNILVEEQDKDTVISKETKIVIPTTTNTPHQENTPTATVVATVGASAAAIELVQQYYDSFIEKDYETVCSLISEFSINLSMISRENMLIELRRIDSQGFEYLDYEILEAEELNDEITLVHVITEEKNGDSDPEFRDSWVVVRREDGQYRYNRGRIIDVWELDVEPQTVNNVTVQPIKMTRSTDELRMIYSINNETQYKLFWGLGNEVVATFQVDDQSYDVYGGNVSSLEANQEYPIAEVRDQRLYREYPDTVELKNIEFDPSVSPGESWSYSFELK